MRLVRAFVTASLFLAGLGLSAVAAPGPATAATAFHYTVNTTNDNSDPDLTNGACDGCGLRAALEQANHNCIGDPSIATTIDFVIAGTGVHTIVLTSSNAPNNVHSYQLPSVTCPIVLDATTQPGYAGKPLIEIDGTNSAAVGTAAGLSFTANTYGSTVRGLAVNRFGGAGIQISGPGGGTATGFVIQANFVGTDPTGTGALPNKGPGIDVAANAQVTIGGPVSGAGNLISGNGTAGSTGGRGINFRPNGPVTGSVVQGNKIGTDVTGTRALPNSAEGISLNGNNGAQIGGTTAGARNLISGNAGNGITIFGSSVGGFVIQGNRIGTQADGVHALGNKGFGIALQNTGGSDTIGGSVAGAGNIVAFNGKAGVQVGAGTGHRISRNSTFSNAGLGVDLTTCSNGACPGPNPNDATDADTGANLFQNYPAVTAVTSTTTASTLKASLTSAASTAYTVEFFSSPTCDPSGYGQGKTFLVAKSVTTAASGTVSFTATVSPRVPVGYVVSATATDPAGNTSEQSPCRGPLTLTPASARAGATVTVAGKGFGAGQTVTILWNCPIAACAAPAAKSLATVTTTSSGTFSKSVTVPSAGAGSYWIGARTTSRFATAPFTVTG